MPSEAWIYLLLIGFSTYFSIAFINVASDILANKVLPFLASLFEKILITVFGVGSIFFPRLIILVTTGNILISVSLAIFRGTTLGISYLITSSLSPYYGTGSGIPEIKSVLSGVVLSDSMTWKTLAAKSLSLVFTVSSEISIGKLGPLVQISSILASLISRLRYFPKLKLCFQLQIQAICAASSAAVGATFGAPLGGIIFAFELLSIYSNIDWMPMALYCSILGHYISNAITKRPSSHFRVSEVYTKESGLHQLVPSVVLGILCGILGALFVHYSKNMFQLQKRHFQTKSNWYITKFLIGFGIIHSLVFSQTSGLLSKSQSKAVEELFTVENTSTINLLPRETNIFHSQRLNLVFSLISLVILKFILTGISITLPICGGVFLPIFQIGALFGRAFGELMGITNTFGSLSPRFASMLGAASMISGSLHTVSFSIIILELTSNQVEVIPLTLSVLVSYGVSKHLSSDLFSEFIALRKIPYFNAFQKFYSWDQEHFFQRDSTDVAGTLMDTAFPFVTPASTRLEIWEMLDNRLTPWETCAFLSDRELKRFWGTVSHQSLSNIIMEDVDDNKHLNLKKPVNIFLLVKRVPGYGSFAANKEQISRGFQTIPFLHEFNPGVGHPLVDTTSIQSSYHTPLSMVISIFRGLGVSQVYITRDGVTVGCVSRLNVAEYCLNRNLKLNRQKHRAYKRMIREKEQSTFSSEPSSSKSSSEKRSSEHYASNLVCDGLPVPVAFRKFRRGGRGMPSSIAEARQIGRNRVTFKIERLITPNEDHEDDLFDMLSIDEQSRC